MVGNRQQLDHIAQLPGELDVGRLKLLDPLDVNILLGHVNVKCEARKYG